MFNESTKSNNGIIKPNDGIIKPNNGIIIPDTKDNFKKAANSYLRKLKSINLIESDFRKEVGEIPDIISFLREFLGRNISDKQKEAYEALWGTKGGHWSKEYHQLVLLIGMKGGKTFGAREI